MIRKPFLVKSVCVLCALAGVMIVVGGCGTNTPTPVATIPSPTATVQANTPTPPPLSAESIQNTSQEIIQFLIARGGSSGVIARTEITRIVQVWDLEQNLEVPRGNDSHGAWSRAQPDMSPCRICAGGKPVETTTRFEVKSNIRVTAEFCRSDSRLVCETIELAKSEGKWQVMYSRENASSFCHCPSSSSSFMPSPIPTR